MKANELMIGDWVKIKTYGISDKYEMTEAYIYVKVAEIGSCLITVEYNNEIKEPYRICEDTEIEPIPLTSEIFARMGFTIEEEPKYDDTYTEDEYTATMKCVDSRKCEVEIEYNTYWKQLRAFNYDPHNRLGFTSIETQIEYVQELQHIMRLLGIEKEIVL